jgi:hypothetical protein
MKHSSRAPGVSAAVWRDIRQSAVETEARGCGERRQTERLASQAGGFQGKPQPLDCGNRAD